jgi:hypothetical protein
LLAEFDEARRGKNAPILNAAAHVDRLGVTLEAGINGVYDLAAFIRIRHGLKGGRREPKMKPNQSSL